MATAVYQFEKPILCHHPCLLFIIRAFVHITSNRIFTCTARHRLLSLIYLLHALQRGVTTLILSVL